MDPFRPYQASSGGFELAQPNLIKGYRLAICLPISAAKKRCGIKLKTCINFTDVSTVYTYRLKLLSLPDLWSTSSLI